jgi:hypothetical protein
LRQVEEPAAFLLLHNRSVTHQLFELHNVRASIGLPSSKRVKQVIKDKLVISRPYGIYSERTPVDEIAAMNNPLR